jgi:hypothetical protein
MRQPGRFEMGKPGNANLPIGVLARANQKIGVPGQSLLNLPKIETPRPSSAEGKAFLHSLNLKIRGATSRIHAKQASDGCY